MSVAKCIHSEVSDIESESGDRPDTQNVMHPEVSDIERESEDSPDKTKLEKVQDKFVVNQVKKIEHENNTVEELERNKQVGAELCQARLELKI